jgi:hypothetical protein
MAKALELTDMSAPPMPRAAQLTPAEEHGPMRKGREAASAEVKREPLQVRWPQEEITAAKIASLQQGFPTVSDFMLECFHAYMKTAKKG